MASAKFGNIIVDMRGKINGNVYSKNKGGAYVRVRVKPSNPRTSFQVGVRSILTSLSQGWKSLTATEIAGWNAAAIQFPKSNRVGDKHVINGNSLYVALNKNLADVGISAISTPPVPTSVATVAVTTATASAGGDTITLTLTGAVPTATSLKLFMSPAVSAGVSSIGTKMRQIASYAAAHAAALAPTSAYTARLGNVGAAGEKIFYKIVPVSTVNGQAGAPTSGVIVIGA